MSLNELIACPKCGIYWMPPGGASGCPMCALKREMNAVDPDAVTEIDELKAKLEAQEVKSEKREATAIDLKNQLDDLNARIDKAQKKSKKSKTVDEVMDKKLEKATEKALKE